MQALFWNGDIETNYLGHIMAEVYKDRIYHPFLIKKEMTVVDVGANVGVTTFLFAKHAKRVISLEPSLEHYECLLKMIEFNKLTNVTPVNKALFIENKPFPFFHNQNRTMYSLHGAVDDKLLPPETVSAITIDTLMAEQKIDRIDILKLDVEGSEVEIVCSEGFMKMSPRIKTIIMEVHAWSGRNPNQMKGALADMGYDITTAQVDANVWVCERI